MSEGAPETERTLANVMTAAELPHLLEHMQSSDATTQRDATRNLRKMLSIETDPPIQEAVDAGFIPRLVSFLSAADAMLQFEAAWALTNIASGTSEHTTAVAESGALPKFVDMLRDYAADDVRDQAVWALGNIAGDSPRLRDVVLQAGALSKLCEVLREDSPKITCMRNVVWTISNLFRGKPQPHLSAIVAAVPTLVAVLQHGDEEVLTDCCWCLSYLTDGANERIQAAVSSGCVPRLVELLSHSTDQIVVPALRTVGNIATGDDSQTQSVVDAGCIPVLDTLLDHTRKGIRKEACWTVSNIAAGNQSQVQALLDSGIMPHMTSVITNDNFDVAKEALWAISNATSSGSEDQVEELVGAGCISAMCRMLDCTDPRSDPRIPIVAMDGLSNVLRVEKSRHPEHAGDPEHLPWLAEVDTCGGVDKLEELQNHEDEEVYDKAIGLLEEFFTVEEEGEGAEGAAEAGPEAGGGDSATLTAALQSLQLSPSAEAQQHPTFDF